MPKTQTMPTVNHNGTPRAQLIATHQKAFNAIQDAITAIQECAPNGRDYPQGLDHLRAALAESKNRAEILAGILDELGNLIVHLDEPIDEEYDRKEWEKYDRGEWHDSDARDRHISRNR